MASEAVCGGDAWHQTSRPSWHRYRDDEAFQKGSFTVTVKARRMLTEELNLTALREAIEQIEPPKLKKAA